MEAPGLATPVALFLFNRPETTVRVFEAIRAARPRRLLVVADGPRSDRVGEAERCAQARAVLERVDWPCQLSTDLAPANLGCRRRLASGLDWIFGQVEEAIVLEDDCLPHPSFFPYAEALLARYREDDRIGVIGGVNFQVHPLRERASYAFTRYPLIWGWASWRRAWRAYDEKLTRWPALRQAGWLTDVLGDEHAQRHWTSIFDRVHRGEIGTWDYQLTLMLWAENQLSILPARNLVSNIGFTGDGTHLSDSGHWLANLPALELPLPLVHPLAVTRDLASDRALEERVFSGPRPPPRPWPSRLLRRLRGKR